MHVTPCTYQGNHKLAFIGVISAYESPSAIGQEYYLLTLHRKRVEDNWSLISISDDSDVYGDINLIVQKLINTDKAVIPDSPATLIAPPDGEYPDPPTGERFGNYIWRPSSSEEVIAEVAEFKYTYSSRLFFSVRNNSVDYDDVNAGWLAGVSWQWRVWSITESGDLIMSETRYSER